MTNADKEALCHRGLDDIFDSGLRTSIGALIEDVRVRGDQAVCDALQKFDGITLTYAGVASNPLRLRVRVDSYKTLVILDEIHHAGDALSWGDAVSEAFGSATKTGFCAKTAL